MIRQRQQMRRQVCGIGAISGLLGCQHTESLPGRLELPTLRLTASRSDQLSYGSL